MEESFEGSAALHEFEGRLRRGGTRNNWQCLFSMSLVARRDCAWLRGVSAPRLAGSPAVPSVDAGTVVCHVPGLCPAENASAQEPNVGLSRDETAFGILRDHVLEGAFRAAPDPDNVMTKVWMTGGRSSPPRARLREHGGSIVGIKAPMKSLVEDRSMSTPTPSGNVVEANASKAVSRALAYDRSIWKLYVDHCSLSYAA